MKTAIAILTFCFFQIGVKANDIKNRSNYCKDSICICKDDPSLSCCRKKNSSYYGNPQTLSSKEKMKYETMQTATCCKHNKKVKQGKNPCANCKKEAVKKN